MLYPYPVVYFKLFSTRHQEYKKGGQLRGKFNAEAHNFRPS